MSIEMRCASVCVAALAAVAIAACGTTDEAKTPPATSKGEAASDGAASPAVFGGLPAGWHQSDDGGATITPRGATAETLATSWDFTGGRHGPAGDVPPGEIFISVLLIRRAEGGQASPRLCRGAPSSSDYPGVRLGELPLRIRNATVGTLEGSPRVPEYRFLGAVRNDYWFEVRVAINRLDPGPKLLGRAQHALNVLGFPDWPNHCARE